VPRQRFGSFALLQTQAARVAPVKILQPDAFALGDAERVDVFLEKVEDFFSRHGETSDF
jgi:hypothetical protein